MRFEFVTIRPQWIMVQLTQQSNEAPRRRVKSLPDAWLGVHSVASGPIEKIGDAERCCPMPKLSAGGQLKIRQADLRGLREGDYRFVVYSRFHIVAMSKLIHFKASGQNHMFLNHTVDPDEEPLLNEFVPRNQRKNVSHKASGKTAKKSKAKAPLPAAALLSVADDGSDAGSDDVADAEANGKAGVLQGVECER